MEIFNWSMQHCSFMSFLFTQFEQQNIKYFILRNYSELPEYNTAKDIDIVIEPGKYIETREILIQTMHKFNIEYYTIHKFDRMRCWYIMDLEKHFSIHIDIIENELYKGYEYFQFNELYANVIPYKNFYVLNPIFDTAMLLIQNLVAYKQLKPKYRKTIEINYAKYPHEIEKLIIDFWGNKIGSKLIFDLRSSNFDNIVENAKELEHVAKKRMFRKKPFYTSINIIRFLLEKFCQIVLCPKERRKFFAVEAPDGTGKTTFINELIKELSFFYNCGPERFKVHHFRPSFLPNLGAAGEKVGVMKQDKDFTNPHRAKPVGKISSFIRMTYYWIDYILGVPILLRKESQYGEYTIFDRYIYDFLVDPRRSRINLPYWLRMVFTKLTQKPRVVFILKATPSIVYKRKQELTLNEITRQMADFERLKNINKNCVFINADNNPQQMVNDALQIIMTKFMHKIS